MTAQGSRTHAVRNARAVRVALNTAREQFKLEQPPCWLCGQAIDYETGDPHNTDALQIDHVFPVSKFPELAADPENMRPSHAGCNQARGNTMTLAELGATSLDWEALAD